MSQESIRRSHASPIDETYVSPALLAAVLLVMLGDVVTTGVGLHLGLQEGNPVVATVIQWFGLPGMVATKAVAAGVLLVLPSFTAESRWAFRVGSAAYLTVGGFVVVSNLLNIVATLW